MNRRRNADYEMKMSKIQFSMVALALLSLTTNFALAKDRDDRQDHQCHGDGRHCLSAPEIDPGQALGALTLLTGTLAIVRGYRRRK
jgi:hypothetical protein